MTGSGTRWWLQLASHTHHHTRHLTFTHPLPTPSRPLFQVNPKAKDTNLRMMHSTCKHCKHKLKGKKDGKWHERAQWLDITNEELLAVNEPATSKRREVRREKEKETEKERARGR